MRLEYDFQIKFFTHLTTSLDHIATTSSLENSLILGEKVIDGESDLISPLPWLILHPRLQDHNPASNPCMEFSSEC